MLGCALLTWTRRDAWFPENEWTLCDAYTSYFIVFVAVFCFFTFHISTFHNRARIANSLLPLLCLLARTTPLQIGSTLSVRSSWVYRYTYLMPDVWGRQQIGFGRLCVLFLLFFCMCVCVCTRHFFYKCCFPYKQSVYTRYTFLYRRPEALQVYPDVWKLHCRTLAFKYLALRRECVNALGPSGPCLQGNSTQIRPGVYAP